MELKTDEHSQGGQQLKQGNLSSAVENAEVSVD